MIHESAVIDQFRAAMAQQGINIDEEIVADGKIRRYKVVGDKGKKNAWAILHIDDHPAGQFGCCKRYGTSHKFSWSYKNPNAKPMTADERREMKRKAAERRAQKAADDARRRADAAVLAQQVWDASAECDGHPYLERKGVAPHGARVGTWEVVNPRTGEVRAVSTNALIIPIRKPGAGIVSLQAIFPDADNLLKRDRDYLKGGEKDGCYFGIGTPIKVDGRPVYILTEGYATGGSIREATGHCAIVAFDRSNLAPVARAIRARQPDAVILFAADNDQWTERPYANPGVIDAQKAAHEVGGLVAWPDFPADHPGKPTDFNDLCQLEGPEAVAAAIEAVLNPKPEAEPEPDPEPPPAPEYEPEPPAPDVPGKHPLERDGYFTILGYDAGHYFVFSHERRQVMTLTKRDLSDTGLIELAPLHWWEMEFPGDKGMNRKMAVNWFIRTATTRGVYDPRHVRGRGVWLDDGRYVFHHGSHLSVDGEKLDITAIQSRYIYPMARQMPEPAPEPLTDEEGFNLLSIAKQVRWSKSASSALMLGWCMLAPVCGALSWRPHIWITGAAGSGKSTIQRDFCYALVRGIAVYAQGNSTEAGIRQTLRADALPVLIDEAESNNERERARIDGILSLIRQSSSESQAQTLKGTAGGDGMNFLIRSMFCLASINTNLEKKADLDRLTKLVIRPPTVGGEDHWATLSDNLHQLATDKTLPERMLARSLALLPTIVANVKVFTRVAARHFGSQRDGDQFGTLLAGCWCAHKSTVASEPEVEGWIAAFDWSEHTEDADLDDAARALDGIMSAKVRPTGTVGEVSVYEVVREAHSLHRLATVPGLDQTLATDALQRHGMRIDEANDLLLLGSSSTSLKKLVANTPYVTDLRGQLLRLQGATRYGDKSMRFNGQVSKCVAIPLSLLFDTPSPSTDPLV